MQPDVATSRDFTLALLEEGLFKLCPDDGAGNTDPLNRPIDQILSLLSLYIEEIERFNPAFGLVNVHNRSELVVRHILDSLAPVNLIRSLLGSSCGADKTQFIADVGSGAGLPGIPLAICMPDSEMTLIERKGKRAGFLRYTQAVLGLSNVRVEEAEMEKLSKKKTNRFNIIVFRAFRPLEPAILKGLFGLLTPGGILAAYKGRRQAIEEEMADVLKNAETGVGPAIGNWEALPLEVPFLNEERHLLLISQPFNNE